MVRLVVKWRIQTCELVMHPRCEKVSLGRETRDSCSTAKLDYGLQSPPPTQQHTSWTTLQQPIQSIDTGYLRSSIPWPASLLSSFLSRPSINRLQPPTPNPKVCLHLAALLRPSVGNFKAEAVLSTILQSRVEQGRGLGCLVEQTLRAPSLRVEHIALCD